MRRPCPTCAAAGLPDDAICDHLSKRDGPDPDALEALFREAEAEPPAPDVGPGAAVQ